jgi:hypothetical protein
MEVNHIAFCASTSAAIATTTCAIAAATTTAGVVATIAYSVLAVGLGAVGIATITAWFERSSRDAQSYCSNLQEHMGYAIAGMLQLASQTFTMALVEGFANGISRAISRAIGGDDLTISHYRRGN